MTASGVSTGKNKKMMNSLCLVAGKGRSDNLITIVWPVSLPTVTISCTENAKKNEFTGFSGSLEIWGGC